MENLIDEKVTYINDCLICKKKIETNNELQNWCSEECKGKLGKRCCKRCDHDFYVLKNTQTSAYCSIKCRTHLCMNCNKPYLKTSSSKFCSTNCRDEYFTYNCRVCGEEYVAKTQTKIPLCSDTCRIAYKKSIKIHRTCKNCKKSIVVGNPSVIYCSEDCRNEYYDKKNKKEKKLTKDQLLDIVVIRVETLLKRREQLLSESFSYTINYNNQSGFTDSLKDQVKKRDHHACYICENNQNLEVHHILPRKLGGQHTEDNLVTLCVKCHRHVETGNKEHAIRKCYENAKLNFGFLDYTLKEQLSKIEIANILENELNRIYTRIVEAKDDIEESLVDFDNIFEYIEKLKNK